MKQLHLNISNYSIAYIIIYEALESFVKYDVILLLLLSE